MSIGLVGGPSRLIGTTGSLAPGFSHFDIRPGFTKRTVRLVNSEPEGAGMKVLKTLFGKMADAVEEERQTDAERRSTFSYLRRD